MPRKRVPRIRVCEWCRNLIGPDRGPAAKTCSEECQRDRNNDKEKKRYQRIKDTPEWKEARADYLERLRARMAANPVLAEQLRERQRANVRKYRAELGKDPVRLAAYRAKRSEWFQNQTLEQRENKRAQNRAWYAGLDPEFKRLFLLQLREKRACEKLDVVA